MSAFETPRNPVFARILQFLRKMFRDAIARNMAWLIGERAIRFLANVVVGFWVARYLGLAAFGRLNYALALVGMFSLLTELGLDSVVKRRLILQPADSGAWVSTAFFLRLVAALLMSVALALVLSWGGLGDAEEQFLLWVLLPMLYQPAFSVADLWLHAGLRAGQVVWAQTMGLLVGALMRMLLIYLGSSVVWFAVPAVAEMLLAALGLGWRAYRFGLRWDPLKAEFARARDLLPEALPLLLAGMAAIVYMRIDILMLRSMKGVEQVAVYSAAVRFSEIWYFLPSVIATSMLPSLLRCRENGHEAYQRRLQELFDASAASSLALAVVTCLVAPWLILFAYGAAYAGAVSVLRIHVWSLVFVFMGVARSQYLINERLGPFLLVASLSGAILNIGLNFLLIPYWGGLGAALATVLACGLSGWGSSYLHSKVRDAAKLQTRALLLPLRVVVKVFSM